MDQDKLMKITYHEKLKIHNHDKNVPFLRAITGHDRTINHGSRYLKYPNHRIMKIPPTPHTRCSLKVFSNLIATYNVGMIIKETQTMQKNCPTVSEFRFLNKILIGSKFVKLSKVVVAILNQKSTR